MPDDDPEFSQDVLRGADSIAHWLYGDRGMRRKVYHLVASSNFPHFKLGSVICARKSTLRAHFKAQEDRHAARQPEKTET